MPPVLLTKAIRYALGSILPIESPRNSMGCLEISMAAWCLMTMRVMHCLAVKFRAVFRWMFTARRKTSMVALAIVEMMIDVSVETIRPVKPGPGTDEDTA